MSAIDDLKVAFRRFRHVSKHGKASPPASAEDVVNAFAPLVSAASAHIKRHEFVQLPCDRMPWTISDLTLEAGEQLSLISIGRLYLSAPLDIWVGPQFGVWGRIGDNGTVFNGSRDTNTITALNAGPLYLCTQFPGQFSEPTGRMQPSLNQYEGTAGAFTTLAIIWKGDAQAGLSAMAAAGDYDGLIAGELARLENPPQAPDGWQHLWFLGQNDIYKQHDHEGKNCIHCHTQENVGILQKNVSLPLTPQTELSWDWNVQKLPSQIAENTLPSHDYLSIAVEFENGRDITYHWSHELPAEKGYWCPLPEWKDREYHVVVRSGEQGLGEWLSERRNLYADYAAHMGEPPKRIVRVWLICNSLLQRQPGVMDISNIVLHDGQAAAQIL